MTIAETLLRRILQSCSINRTYACGISTKPRRGLRMTLEPEMSEIKVGILRELL
jgi:hypothetical protein